MTIHLADYIPLATSLAAIAGLGGWVAMGFRVRELSGRLDLLADRLEGRPIPAGTTPTDVAVEGLRRDIEGIRVQAERRANLTDRDVTDLEDDMQEHDDRLTRVE